MNYVVFPNSYTRSCRCGAADADAAAVYCGCFCGAVQPTVT